MELQQIEHIWNLMARKLSGEANEAECIELEQLLRQHPEENYSMEVMQDLWKSKPHIDRKYSENEYKELIMRFKQMGIDENMFSHDDHYITEEQENKNKKSFWKKGLAISLVLIIGLTAGIMLNKKKISTLRESMTDNIITTKNGSKTDLVLPDGSKVWLNAGSKITYSKNYGIKLREITLSGEAFFDVVKNAEKPFVIHTGKMDIKVLGTAFNVKCYPNEKTFEASLIRGRIEITFKDRMEKIMLKPDEKLILNTNEIKEERTAATIKTKNVKREEPIISVVPLTHEPETNEVLETGWVQNRLIFNDETFEEVAVKMERWYGVKFTINNTPLKTKRFTGIFENETITQALTALRYTTMFNFVINKENIIISQ